MICVYIEREGGEEEIGGGQADLTMCLDMAGEGVRYSTRIQ